MRRDVRRLVPKQLLAILELNAGGPQAESGRSADEPRQLSRFLVNLK